LLFSLSLDIDHRRGVSGRYIRGHACGFGPQWVLTDHVQGLLLLNRHVGYRFHPLFTGERATWPRKCVKKMPPSRKRQSDSPHALDENRQGTKFGAKMRRYSLPGTLIRSSDCRWAVRAVEIGRFGLKTGATLQTTLLSW
jgi:hypothetical protein